tara:strand:- start:1401 stop:2708 length:1308 start_codon:yes stop_codon:yes gene_type:complete
MQNNDAIKRDSGEIFVSSITKWLKTFIENTIEMDIVHFVGILFVMYAGNSYFGLTMFDSQPFPVMVAAAFIILRIFVREGNLKTPILFVTIGLLAVFGIVIGASQFFQFNMLFIRGVINYASIIIFMIAFYEFIKVYGFPLKILVAINLLWIFVALIQLIEPGVVSMFVAERTSAGRGVTSLGPEPSSFGFYLFFISWIYLLVTDYQPPLWLKILIGINVLSIFFLAKSALTIVFLIVSFLFYVVLNFKSLLNFRNIILTLTGIIIFIFVISVVLEGSRMERLFFQLLNADLALVLEGDRSVNSRLAHQVLPIYIFLSNLGFPAGLQSFVANVNDLDPSIVEFLWGNISDEKIMSWNATLIYELGLFGILVWILLFTFLMDGTLNRFGELSLLFVLLFSSVPQSYPLIPLIFVIMYMTNKRFTMIKKKMSVTKSG